MMMLSMYIHTHIERMSVIWFDWGIDFCACRSKQSVASIIIMSRRFESTKHEMKFSYLMMFGFEKRDDASFAFFFSLSGKTQVNIYLLSSLILHCIYVTRSGQSEGRSLNTSSTHYRLSTAKEGLLIEKGYFHLYSIMINPKYRRMMMETVLMLDG